MLIRIPFSQVSKVRSLSFLFSEQNPEEKDKKQKSYFMPDQQNYNDVYDYFDMKKPYVPPKPLHFKNGRYLLYMNKQHLWTPYIFSSHISLPFAYFGFLIYKNPFYLTFPAALPLLFIAEGILLLRWIAHKAHFKNQIQRIYLLETGDHLQFCYSNKIKRYIKNNEMIKPIVINTLNDKYDVDDENIQPIRGTRFPRTKQQLKDKKPYIWQYGWTKRDKFFQTFIVPSKNYEYADWELLLATMNGHRVEVQDCIFEGELSLENTPAVEEQIENIKELMKENSQPTTNKEQEKDGKRKQ